MGVGGGVSEVGSVTGVGDSLVVVSKLWWLNTSSERTRILGNYWEGVGGWWYLTSSKKKMEFAEKMTCFHGISK